MGKISTLFQYPHSMMTNMGPTPKQLYEAFGQLPGNTQIISVAFYPNMSSAFTVCEVEAENDFLPDGTHVDIEYCRETFIDPYTGFQKEFDICKGPRFAWPPLPATPGGYAYPPPVLPPNPVYLPKPTPDPNYGLDKAKCNCGSSAVGSSVHSDWCDVK